MNRLPFSVHVRMVNQWFGILVVPNGPFVHSEFENLWRVRARSERNRCFRAADVYRFRVGCMRMDLRQQQSQDEKS